MRGAGPPSVRHNVGGADRAIRAVPGALSGQAGSAFVASSPAAGGCAPRSGPTRAGTSRRCRRPCDGTEARHATPRGTHAMLAAAADHRAGRVLRRGAGPLAAAGGRLTFP
ncbi:hypothetical protein GCM10010964_22020 [Caldovatus sediminis]|uniref:Uncharacterized protein n=1 Tax=Caldovatus sediminis TaxID=2041189 RepID=A0A8J2ZBR0_9PROT|nr:hypothetical protein GCM10010964_22020 [Caldovatus sediminis]